MKGKMENGLALLDHSTGEFLVAQGKPEYIDKLIGNFQPGEILLPKPDQKSFKEKHGDRFFTYALDEWVFQPDYAREMLLNQFETASLKGFGIEDRDLAVMAAGACLHYLNETNHNKTSHITSISRIEEDRFMWLDGFTMRNLELLQSTSERGTSLFDVINRSITPMGSRMLRRWLALPLKDRKPVQDRLNVVDCFLHQPELAARVEQALKQSGDIERIIARVAVQKIGPREVQQLQRALHVIQPLRELLSETNEPMLAMMAEEALGGR
jgi:DNA mismatch repair protein MutS